MTPTPRIAVFHDNFAQMGGAERVAEALMSALPEAALHTTLAAPAKLIPALQQRPMRTTWMQRLPSPGRYYRHYFMLYPFAVEGVDLGDYDLVVSSDFGYAKGIHTRPDAVHVCYCYTPMRWVWRHDDYVARERFGRGQRLAMSAVLPWLRRWDLRAAQRPDSSSPHPGSSPSGSRSATGAVPSSSRRRSTSTASALPRPRATVI